MQGWLLFARRVVEALKTYDTQNGSNYAKELDDEFGIAVLAATMDRVDRGNMWEVIGEAKTVEARKND